jgi:hypothetical protein
MKNVKKTTLLFNKLGQLRKEPKILGIEALNKRAKAKYTQDPLINNLCSLNSKLNKQYINAKLCSSTLEQIGNKVISKYCKNRFCRICNRIATGKLINGYTPVLAQMVNKMFVTLTIPNVEGKILRSAIQKMNKTMRLIQDKRRKQKKPVYRAIRKLECTYNVHKNNYHPHYHLILEGGEAQADNLIQDWLSYYPESVAKAQHKTEAREYLELFKYFTKLTSNAGATYANGSKVIDEYSFPEAIDVIFTAIYRLRIIQPMGGIKYIKEEIDELTAELIDETLPVKNTIYLWNGENWYNPFTLENFSSFKPTINLSKYRQKIRYLDNIKNFLNNTKYLK